MVYHGKARTFPYGGLISDTNNLTGLGRIPISPTRIRPSSPFLGIVRILTMPGDTSDTREWEITTKAEFDSALQSLLLSALENGLDLYGAWEYRNGEVYPDLEVLVTELAKSN